MVQVGDQVKIAYLSDAHPCNNQTGTVSWTRQYRYYPKGTPGEWVWKQPCTIRYPDGSSLPVSDTERAGSGAVSPLIKVDV